MSRCLEYLGFVAYLSYLRKVLFCLLRKRRESPVLWESLSAVLEAGSCAVLLAPGPGCDILIKCGFIRKPP